MAKTEAYRYQLFDRMLEQQDPSGGLKDAVTNQVKLLARKLSVSKIATDQPAMLAVIRQELCETRPMLFGGPDKEERIALALSAVGRAHSQRRYDKKKPTTVEGSQTSKRKEVDVQTTHDSASMAMNKSKPAVNTGTGLAEKNPQATAIAAPVGRKKFKPALDIAYGPPAQGLRPRPTKEDDGKVIRDCLNACTPPMGRLFDAFSSYGCKDEEHVRAVLTWDALEISAWIRNVANAAGEPITQMEIDILRMWFLRYFNASK